MPAMSRAAAGISGAGAVLRLIRHGAATTRGDLVTTTGLARSTISQRVDALLSQRLLVAEADAASTGGRPPQVLGFNREAGSCSPPTSARRTPASR